MERILLGLFVIIVGASLVSALFERLRLPVLVGEILLGVAIAALAPHLLAGEEVFPVIAELGVIVLLFAVGLETKVEDLLRVGGTAAGVAVLGVVVPFALGYALMSYLGYSLQAAAFMGAAMVATSVGITARVLSELGVIRRKESRIILGAAVVDDVLGLVLLAVVTGASKGSVSVASIAVLVLEVVLFIGFFLYFGTHLARRHSQWLKRVRTGEAPYVFALGATLLLSALAESIGLAAIVGAFMAGVIFAEVEDHYQVRKKISVIYDFLVPFFFVMVGTNIKVAALAKPQVAWLALAVIALAVIGKIVGCGLPALGLGARRALRVAVGMVPRGEVGIIVALIGSRLGVINTDLFAVIVVMSVVTTLIAPFMLQLAFRAEPGSAPRTVNETVE